MTETCRIVVLCSVCMSMLLLNSCKKEDEETETKLSMTGALYHNIPEYLYRSRTYTFTATGITEPEEGVTYTWAAKGFYPDSCFTQSFTFTTPDLPGAYSIGLSASYEEYYDRNASQTVFVIDSLHFGCLTGITEGSDWIEDPRDGAIYHTRIYGDLEWFVQNLNWAGAGYPYAKIEAMGTPFGRLYSWNEALTAVAGGETPGEAANGLGQGPQGVCPPGWSIPTNDDWAHFATVINGGEALSFFDNWNNIAEPLCANAKLFDTYQWPYSPRNTKTNLALWNGLPAGNSVDYGNHYALLGTYGFWLSASQADENNGYYRYINYDVNTFPYHATDKSSFGASVRCVRLVVEDEDLPELTDEL